MPRVGGSGLFYSISMLFSRYRERFTPTRKVNIAVQGIKVEIRLTYLPCRVPFLKTTDDGSGVGDVLATPSI
jgi:hypothetical protein